MAEQRDYPIPYEADLTDQLVQGATLGFGDEVGAAGSTLADALVSLFMDDQQEEQLYGPGGFSFGRSYQNNLGALRQGIGQYAEENPSLSLATQLAGGLGSIVAATPATGAALPAAASFGPGVTRAGSTTRLVGTGAGLGAAAGAGYSDGDDTLTDAAIGAGLGGLWGAAVPAIMAGGRLVRDVWRGVFGGPSNPSRPALAQISRAYARDEVTPEQLTERIAAAEAAGQPMTPADLGGQNVLRLGRTVETIPGRGSEIAHEALGGRSSGALDRGVAAIRRVFTSDDALAAEQALRQHQRQVAAPAYETAFAHPPVARAELDRWLGRPAFQTAYRSARRIAANEGVELPVQIADELDWQTLDYIKRGVDDQISRLGRAGSNNERRVLVEALSEFRARLDDINPDYAAARRLYADDAAARDALEAGQAFARSGSDAEIAAFRALSQGEQDYFRIGFARELRHGVERLRGTPGHDQVINSIASSVEQQRRLQTVLGDDLFGEFMAWVDSERLMGRTARTVLGGSPTGRLAAEQSDAAAFSLADAFVQSRGSPRQRIWNALSNSVSRARGISEPVAARIGERLFSADPAAGRNLAMELARLQAQPMAPNQGAPGPYSRWLANAIARSEAASAPVVVDWLQ